MTDADVNTSAKATASPPLAELKNGKIFFKQKCVSLEKLSETMQEIVSFRNMLQRRIQDQEPPLDSMPTEHKPLLGKLIHESDKTLPALCKHVQRQLLAEDDDINRSPPDAVLPLAVLEKEIKSIAERKNYGLDSSADGVKVPASLCVWRWELDRQFWDWLPKSARERAETRYQERLDAKARLASLFDSLPDKEREALLSIRGPGRPPKHKEKEPTKDNATRPQGQEVPDSVPVVQSAQRDEQTPESSATPTKCVGRAKKDLSPETAAAEKEKLEKKAAKAEKERKEKEAEAKSKSAFVSFFTKGKTPSLNSHVSPRKEAKDNKAESSASASQSDFERLFRPFALKKGAELAPDNWFKQAKNGRLVRNGRLSGEVIIIDGDEGDPDQDVAMHDVQPTDKELSSQSSRERLSSLLAQLPPSANPALLQRPRWTTAHLKTHSQYSVRDIMSQLSEAEVAGDESRVRELLDLLRSRSKIPARVLCFADNARPGYFGTFTRTSRIIGPRCPFARDAITHDYNYDSGEEWEEEGEGEEVDEGSDEEKEDAATEDADSDLDGWLVDDDEVGDPGTPIEDREGSPGFFPPLPVQDKKRKSAVSEARPKVEKRRKVVVPLVPFTKGPCWEHVIGKCDYEPFEPYRISLFNDTPYPIDPFTFVSAPPTAVKAPAPATDGVFLVPPVPSTSHTQAALAEAPRSTQPKAAVGPSNVTKRASITAPRTCFPEDQLPALLAKIRSSPTSNLTVLVEIIYSSLQEQGVKVRKNAVETKVREVSEKCKLRKVWVVKGESQEAAVS
ncbi:hypothetical protein GLOTRDRAFT_104339 [Gloeophyllum trabeum ATCC 11539]|uniref:Chromatin assembly factor 1 subunit A dimerization domain-containing protein n=1 Tax=Gloeophyllum trabeum (strain ATCC 11539 / FP-39264 / Madison 617) TaxID=670483 RepID=S7QFV4_GLOTA|nr:uncharacterized protein GLOTRDRAFT_104339 [Gloeophyllum trabeum ATCC 11539]EPQ58751.1 hypothetical protein GLOTRDRAFT_104339 [Gloeophyllum trabeum ATCC 11539]